MVCRYGIRCRELAAVPVSALLSLRRIRRTTQKTFKRTKTTGSPGITLTHRLYRLKEGKTLFVRFKQYRVDERQKPTGRGRSRTRLQAPQDEIDFYQLSR